MEGDFKRTSPQKLSYATLDRIVTNFLILDFVRVKELARQTTQLAALKALYSRCSCYRYRQVDMGEKGNTKCQNTIIICEENKKLAAAEENLLMMKVKKKTPPKKKQFVVMLSNPNSMTSEMKLT